MNISELLIPELKHEVALSEKFIQRVPQDKLDWTPHEKSMNIKKLCNHIAELPTWVTVTMNTDELEMSNYAPTVHDSIDDIVAELKSNAESALAALEKDNDIYWQDWAMKQGGEVLMKMPRYTTLRTMVLGQFPHHRAQLGVYLRMLDVSVPASYGPSADEQ